MVDACATDVGGFLSDDTGRIISYFHDALTTEDEQVLQTERSAAGW